MKIGVIAIISWIMIIKIEIHFSSDNPQSQQKLMKKQTSSDNLPPQKRKLSSIEDCLEI